MLKEVSSDVASARERDPAARGIGTLEILTGWAGGQALLAHRVARLDHLGGIDGLAAAMLVAAVVVTPIGGWSAVPAFADPVALAAGVGVAVSSSVIPYVCDQLAMARMARSTYALFVSLLPATATVVAVVVLAQLPTPIEVVAISLVIGGVALHQERPSA